MRKLQSRVQDVTSLIRAAQRLVAETLSAQQTLNSAQKQPQVSYASKEFYKYCVRFIAFTDNYSVPLIVSVPVSSCKLHVQHQSHYNSKSESSTTHPADSTSSHAHGNQVRQLRVVQAQ